MTSVSIMRKTAASLLSFLTLVALPGLVEAQTYSSGTYSVAVPANVYSVTVTLRGGGGGGGGGDQSPYAGGFGGSGARIVGVVKVLPGQILSGNVGGAGGGGSSNPGCPYYGSAGAGNGAGGSGSPNNCSDPYVTGGGGGGGGGSSFAVAGVVKLKAGGGGGGGGGAFNISVGGAGGSSATFTSAANCTSTGTGGTGGGPAVESGGRGGGGGGYVGGAAGGFDSGGGGAATSCYVLTDLTAAPTTTANGGGGGGGSTSGGPGQSVPGGSGGAGNVVLLFAAAQPITLQTAKAWGANNSSDTARISATTGGTPNNTAAFTSNGGTAANSGTAVNISGGNTVTFPAESFTSGSLANYNTTFTCNATNAPSSANGQVSNTLVVTGADAGKAIVCTYTNTGKSSDLSIVKSQSLINGSFTTGTLKAPAVLNPMYFSLVVSNLSGATATNATYSDTVPSQFINPAVVSTSVGGTATCPAPSFSGSTLSGTATIPVGSSCTIIYSAVPNTLTSPTVGVINTATVAAASGVTDTNTANNTSSVTTFINPTIRLNLVVNGVNTLFNLSIAANLSPNSNPTTAFPNGGTNPQNNVGTTGTTGWVMVDAGNNGSTYSTATVAETAAGTTVLANYVSNLACIDGTGASYLNGFPGYPGGPIVAGNTSNGITAPQNPTAGLATQITCTYTNTVKTATIQSSKTWGTGSPSADIANVFGTTGGTLNGAASNTSSFSTAGGNPLSSNVVTVSAGDTLTFAAENFTPAASASHYATSLVCLANGGATANPVSSANGQVNNTLLIGAGDSGKAIVCTFNNVPLLADLAIAKTQRLGTSGTFGTGSVRAFFGDIVQYQLVMTNNGPAAAPNTTFSDPIPGNLTGITIVSTTPGPGVACTATAGATVTGTVSTFPSGGTCTIVIQATANALTDPTSGAVNTATVTVPAGLTDTNTANNTSSVTTFIDGSVVVNKVVVGTPPAGDNGLFNLTFPVTPAMGPALVGATSQGNGGTTGAPQRIYAGAASNPIYFNETATAGSNLANYTTTSSCTLGTGAGPIPGTNSYFYVANGYSGSANTNVVCTITNTAKATPTVTIRKISNGGTSTFAFTGTNGIGTSVTTTTAGTAASGPTQTLTATNSGATITETTQTGFALAGAICTGMGSGGTATLSGTTLTLDAAATAAGSNIICTFTNSKTATVILQKAWRNGTDNNGTTSTTSIPAITLGMTTPTGSVNSTSASGVPSNNSTSSTSGTAAVGATLTLPAETLGSGAARFGVATYSCVDGTTTVNNIAQGGTVTVPASSGGGTLTCTLTNAALPVVVLGKAARAGSQSPTFNFTVSGASNASAAFAFTPSNSVVTQYAAQEHLGTVGTAVVITEGSTSNWPSAPASAVCTDLNAANSGNPATIPIVSNNATATYTVPAANMVLGANIQCVFSNEQPQVTLNKSFVGTAPDSGLFTLRISGTNSTPGNADVTAPANYSTSGGGTVYAVVNAGPAPVTLSETAGSGTSLSNYSASIACKDANNLAYATTPTSGVPGSWSLVPPSGYISGNSEFIRCDITNTAKITLQLSKVWGANSIAGDVANIGATTGGSANTTAFTSSVPTTASSAQVTVLVGDTLTLPGETLSPGTLANYTTVLSCKANGGAMASALSGSNGQVGNSLVLAVGDSGKAIVCTYTNTPKATTLRLRKIFAVNSIQNDAITVSTTGGSTNPTLNASASTAGTTTTGTSVAVTAGNSITLPAETFTTGSQASYTTRVSCNNTVSPVTNAALPQTFTVAPADPPLTCTYTNTPNSPTLQLNKTFAVNSTAGHTISATSSGGTNPATIAATATAAGNTTNGTAVTVSVGNAITLPVETFGGGASASNYTSTVSCNNSATPLTNAALPASFTVAAVDTAIVCIYTNTPKPTLDTTKVLQGINGVAAVAGATVKAGDILDYQISVTNTGGSSGTTTLTDNVPANTVFSSAAPSLGWSCANGAASGTACTQTVNVAAGATTLLGYRVTVFNPLPVGTASIANSVTTSTGTCSSCSVNNPTVAVLDTSKALVKVNGAVTTGTATVAGGDVFLYNIVVRNTGGSSSTTVLSETVPDHTNYTGSGEGWSCATGSAAGIVCTLSITTAPGSVTTPFTVTVVNPLPVGTTTIVNTVTTSVGTCSACTVTTPGTNLDVSGRVFTDNGVGGGTANDGLINGAEVGVARVGIKLTNCAATIYGTTITDGTGGFKIGVNSSLPVGSLLCVEETNPATRISTGASYGSTALASGTAVTVSGTSYTYTRTGTPDRIAFAWNGTGHAGLNFGDVDPNTFVADGTKGGQPGSTVSYSHTFTAQTGGSVSFTIASAVAAPTLAGWNEKVFADVGCTGTLQAGAAVLYPPAAPMTVVAGQQVCIVMQEFIPATAQNGYVNTVKLEADFNFTNAAPTLSGSYQVTDVTTVGSSALDLKKEVRNVTQGGVFGVNNQAKSGETLEYRITYTNNAAAPISTLAINDTTPAYSTFVSSLLESTPATLTACAKNTPANPLPAATVACPTAQAVGGTGPLDWKFTGSLAPGGTGAVLFQVKVN